MPQVEISIGGRSFDVACQDGEEHFLRSAAAMLDIEASVLSTQIGRMPDARMLLMAGLMLADKTAGLEDKLLEAEKRLADLQDQLESGETSTVSITATTEYVDVPIIPLEVTDTFEAIARNAEALADAAEARLNP